MKETCFLIVYLPVIRSEDKKLLCVRLHFVDYIAQQAEEPNDRRAQLLLLLLRVSVCVCAYECMCVSCKFRLVCVFGQGPLLLRFVQRQAGHRIGIQYLGGILFSQQSHVAQLCCWLVCVAAARCSWIEVARPLSEFAPGMNRKRQTHQAGTTLTSRPEKRTTC